MWTVKRSVSLNDIYADLLGVGVGIVLWGALGRWSIARLRELWQPQDEARPIKRALQLYAVAFFLYCVQPLDIALSGEALATKIEEGRVLLRPFGHTYGSAANLIWQVGGDVLLFVPIGMMLRLKGRAMRSLLGATLLGVVVATMIEAAQFLVFSRYTDVTDIFTSGLGALIGGLLAARLPRASKVDAGRTSWSVGARVTGAAALVALYTVPLVAAFWHPYARVASAQVFEANLRGFLAAPFQGYYAGGEFAAMTNVVRGVMLFVPIGAVARWAVGRRSVVAAMFVCALATLPVGLLIEIGQAGLKNKYADVTDLGIYLTGGLLGWMLAHMLLGDAPRPVRRPASQA